MYLTPCLLIGNICYLFGVHGYTVKGYGLWTAISNQRVFSVTVIGNQTLIELQVA